MTNDSLIVAPSILAADFGALRSEISDVERAGADWIHIDVMDGHFVPPITFGDNLVRLAASCSKLFRDVHLMVKNPEQQIDTFVAAGAQRIIVHQEATPHLHRVLSRIRECGVENGVAINPATPVNQIYDVLEVCDLALVMTVNPGWGGQKLIPHCVEKVRALNGEISRRGLRTLIEVDGGITSSTARSCTEAGARVLVAGSSVFGAADRSTAIKALRIR